MGSSCSFLGRDNSKYAAKEPASNGNLKTAQSCSDKSVSSKKKRVWVLGQTVDIKSMYDFGKVLGKGQFGTTRLVVEVETGKEFACKSICKRKLTTEDDIDDVRREVQIMYHLAGHANIVRIRAAFEDRQFVHLVMDLCTGGELFDRIVQRGCFTEKQASSAFFTMASVIGHCHKMGVIHRDLKPENFLLSDKTDGAALLATDFGLSVFYKEGQTFEETLGSAYYVAPEVLLRRYSKEADVWSLGVLLYILLSGVPPFAGETDADTFNEIMSAKLDFVSDPWPKISDPAKDCVRRMLVRNPHRRASAAEILQHPWVQPGGVAASVQLQSGVVSRMQGFAAINKLKREALKAIASHLTSQEITALRARIAALDVHNSGIIRVSDLRLCLRQAGTRIPESDLDAMLHDVEAIGNCTIDYEELMSATVNQSKLEKEDNLFTSLRRLDQNGTGFIPRDDLRSAIGPGRAHSVETVDDIDALIAATGTNTAGHVDYEELCDKIRATDTTTLHATRTIKTGLAFSIRTRERLDARRRDDDVGVVLG